MNVKRKSLFIAVMLSYEGERKQEMKKWETIFLSDMTEEEAESF